MAENNEKKGKSVSKKGFFSKISKSIKDMRGELKKVVWPSKKQVLNNTGVVLLTCVVFAIFLGGLDFLLTSLITLVFGG